MINHTSPTESFIFICLAYLCVAYCPHFFNVQFFLKSGKGNFACTKSEYSWAHLLVKNKSINLDLLCSCDAEPNFFFLLDLVHMTAFGRNMNSICQMSHQDVRSNWDVTFIQGSGMPSGYHRSVECKTSAWLKRQQKDKFISGVPKLFGCRESNFSYESFSIPHAHCFC